MICDDQDHIQAESSSVETVVESLSDQDEAVTMSKAIDVVRAKYKKRSRIGLLALVIAPTLLLVVMSIYSAFIDVDINTKLIWMTVWMLSVISIATYVIVIEYKYKQFKKEE